MAVQPRRPRRPELGQHFLRRGALAAEIVAHAPIAARDLVLEIGPGTGALTRELARRGARVRAIELDAALAAALRTDFAGTPHVEIVQGDFLATPLPREPFLAIGNIPFGRTTEIVRRLTEDAAPPPRDALLVVQRESAERFAGGPFAPESLRSLLLKPWWQVEIVRPLPARMFDPPPAVDAALLWFAHRSRPLVDDRDAPAYRRFVTTSFGRRGHAAGAALGRVFTRTQLERLGRELRFDAGRTRGDAPSTLTFDQWLALFRASIRLGRGPDSARRDASRRY